MKTKFTLLSFLIAMLFSQSVSALTYTVHVPAETKVCYIVGDPTGWKTFLEMERVGTSNTFTLEIADATEDQTVSFAAGPGWDFEEVNSEGSGVAYKGAGPHTVGTWKAISDPAAPLVYTVHVPAETKVCYMVGDATGGWNNFLQMERVGTSNTFTISLSGASKTGWNTYAAGPGWEYQEINSEGKSVARQWEETHTALYWEAIYDDPSTNISEEAPSTRVFVQDNRIIADDIYGIINLYTIDGLNIQKEASGGEFISNYLDKGVYILQTEKTTTKVLVP